jgi:hypothetical protein
MRSAEMNKGLLVFTEGKEVIGARITKASYSSEKLDISYEFRIEAIGYTGSLKATSSDGERWSGEWTDRDQKWKSVSGTADLTCVHNQARGLFYGTWTTADGKEQGEWTMDVELPRGYR